MVRCTNGTQMEVHPAYKFTDVEWGILPEAEKSKIIQERNQYKRSRQNSSINSSISEITTVTHQDIESLNNLVVKLQ